ncbi:MAG: cbb3-type cytochrome c oxidase subunit I [Bacteroidetes bacterium]|nr:cbb3-type cytochrome c oxidase subunit I [Bacteroidota bacterium]
MEHKRISLLFIATALITLVIGVLFGMIGGLQYILPEFLKEYLSFEKSRPLHVTLVITWIFTGAVGGVYYYLPEIAQRKLFSINLARTHYALFVTTGITILICYFTGNFGGREYLEFPPILAIPMLFSWILFAINFIMTIRKKVSDWPIYLWMWSTGVLFFLITFGESYLWTLPYFRDNIIRDVTVQWKANGSMVGSWNMLVYGTGFYIMEQISGDKKTATAPITYFFYFLGLTNLMFNWGHHTYIVPAAPWVKNVAYIISMTELLILGSIILNWQKSLSVAKKNLHSVPYRFIAAADIWIFLNLTLAILMSIPAINKYTHGTHITVAHAMGSTIGINTMILFASLYYIFERNDGAVKNRKTRIGFFVVNLSLILFWVTLIMSGIVKAMEVENGMAFQKMMLQLQPLFKMLNSAGLGIFVGLFLLSIPLLTKFSTIILSTDKLLSKKSKL